MNNNSTQHKEEVGNDSSKSEAPRRRKSPPRLLTVVNNIQLSPNMRRITLGGDNMAGFPVGRESANFKLLLPREGQLVPNLSTDKNKTSDEEKAIVRTYTVRKYYPEKEQVDVDFFIHRDPGPASRWALHALPGDQVGFAGPGPDKLVDHKKDWFLFAGDMSALPAIGANIERLPADARGYAILEIVDPLDAQDLPFPGGMEVHWILNPHPEKKNTCLLDAVRSIKWLDGTPGVWMAGESYTIRALKKYIREDHALKSDSIYCSGYWQTGLTEDRHQIVKKQDKDV